jgi:hypothetical protein
MRNLYALILGASVSLTPALSLASVTSRETTTRRDAATLVAPRSAAHTSVAASASTDDLSRYAARDAASPEAKNYRGGDTVVIGATAATAILAVLLLVILL